MAKFNLTPSDLGIDIIKDLNKLENDLPVMMEEMTQAGADVVLGNLVSTISNTPIAHLAGYMVKDKARDGRKFSGKATRIYVHGYIKTSGWSKGSVKSKQGIPVPYLYNIYDMGRSDIGKTRFWRRGWKMSKDGVAEAMLKIQEKYLPQDR